MCRAQANSSLPGVIAHRVWHFQDSKIPPAVTIFQLYAGGCPYLRLVVSKECQILWWQDCCRNINRKTLAQLWVMVCPSMFSGKSCLQLWSLLVFFLKATDWWETNGWPVLSGKPGTCRERNCWTVGTSQWNPIILYSKLHQSGRWQGRKVERAADHCVNVFISAFVISRQLLKFQKRFQKRFACNCCIVHCLSLTRLAKQYLSR